MTSVHTHGYSNYMGGGTIIETLSRVVWVCCLSGTNTIPSFICRWVCLCVMWWWLEGTTTIGFNPFDWLLLVPLVFIGGEGCSLLIVRPRGIPTDRLITFVDNPHLLFFRPCLPTPFTLFVFVFFCYCQLSAGKRRRRRRLLSLGCCCCFVPFGTCKWTLITFFITWRRGKNVRERR